MLKLLMITDDFTGALDTGIQFTKQGVKIQIAVEQNPENISVSENTQVLVIDLETRPLAGQQAYETVKNIMLWAKKQNIEYIYKKTDSALRGNVGTELKAVADVYNQCVYFIPAFPKIGRVTRNGKHYIDNVPLSETAFAKDPFEPVKHSHIKDIITKEYNIDVTKFKHKALIGDGVIAGKKVLLVKPQTYMNLSGESIREILKFYKIPIEQFYVIYDDTSLPLSSVRIREKGSAGGHNGIKNIIAHLNTDAFIRIKVGIGEKPNGWDLADYVLAKFSKDDEPLILSGVEKASHAIEILLTKGIVEAMNQTNQKLKKENKKSKPSNTNEVIS